MPKNRFVKSIFAVALAALLASAFLTVAHAYNSVVGTSLQEVLPYGIQADIFYTFDDGTTNGFVSSGGTNCTIYSNYDEILQSRTLFFSIGSGKNAGSGADKSFEGIKIEYHEPQDLFYYRKFFYSCFIERADANNVKYYTKAVFYSDTEKKEYTTEIHGDTWNTVCFDVSDLSFRNKVKSVEILFVAMGDNGSIISDRVKVDDVGFADKANAKKADAFMNDTFSVDGAILSFNGADSITLSFEDKTAEFSGDILVRNKSDKNAFRMIMANRSDCTSVTLYYADVANEFTKENSVSLPISAGEEKREYVFEIKDGETPSKIKVVFEGAESGESEIYSFSMISRSTERKNLAGEISSVRISEDKEFLTVKGTVDYKTAVNYKNCKLALYRLNFTESDESTYAENAKPIDIISMTSKFEFHIPITEPPAVWEKYVVRVFSEKGQIPFIPIDYAKYIENYDIYASGSTIYAPVSPKGIQSESSSYVERTNAAHIVEDVYLDEMISEKNSGYLYTANGKYYYYRKEYIDLLDKKIRQYSDAGKAVYLRILYRDENGRLVSPAVLADEFFTVSATDFLCSRYNSDENGKIAGLILGEKTDLANKYNYMGELPLNEYVKKYVSLFRIVYNTAKQNNGGLKIYIPISDTVGKERYSEEDLLGEMYDKNSFVKSLCREIESGGDAKWYLFYENEESGYTLSNTIEFSALLGECHSSYKSSPASVMYFWKPSKKVNAPTAEYAYLYYRLKFENNADIFVVSLSDIEKNEKPKNNDELLDVIKYIDTSLSAKMSETTLKYFGTDDWSALVPGFNRAVTEVVKLYEAVLHESIDDKEIKGKTDLWDFSAAHSSLGWDVGSNCDSLKYGEDETGTFLSSEFSASNAGEYSSIIYSYENPMDYSKIPIIEFELAANSDNAKQEELEVCITFAGEKEIFESTGKVQNGKICNLYANISDFSAGNNIEYIRIQINGTGEAENLRIYRITGHSTEYDDAELTEMLSASDNTGGTMPFNSMWIMIIATAVIISIAVFIWLTKNDNKEN